MITLGFHTFGQQGEPLIFNQKTHDFGSIREDGGSVSTEFTFINNSQRPIKIVNVKPSCGCTTPDWTREAVEPGKSGSIKASFEPRGRAGFFTKTITVITDYSAQNMVLQIKGNVESKVTVVPASFDVHNGSLSTKVSTFNLGKLFINKEANDVGFELKNNGKQVLTFTEYKAPTYVRVKLPQPLKPGEVGFVLIQYDAKARNQYGFASDNIELITDDAVNPIKAFSLFATVEEYFEPLTGEALAKAPMLRMEGADIRFGEMFETGILTREVVINNTGKTELLIREVQPNCTCVVAEALNKKIKPGENGRIKITFTPKGRPGVQNKVITVYSNDPRNPVQRINLSGYVR
jgi:hypothetical protein